MDGCLAQPQSGGVVGVTLDLLRSLGLLTEQLVGNEVSQLPAHLPATQHLRLSIQHTMQTGI